MDLFGGLSESNVNGDTLHYALASIPEPPPSPIRRRGLGIRLATGRLRHLQADESGETPGLANWLGNTLTLTATVEGIQDRARDFMAGPAPEETAYGVEAEILGVLYLRAGHIRNAPSEIDGSTSGYGINLHYADAIAIRYDRASYPEAVGLSNLHPWSWSFNLNPYGVLKVLLDVTR